MPVAIGSKLGFYEVTALLGKGGMGEVYRARDSKLKRDVAIKVLPEEFSRDPERLGRFQREAETLASLNHSNIAGIHELAEDAGTRFLVLELVEGETLAERIARGALPFDESLDIAKQIAEALEAAHEQGIVHRDLKPANVKITPGGRVKVLDFGLAKMRDPIGGAASATSNSPTTMGGSIPGVILGTAAYMAPEQARGRPVDRRADIFAYGCVLYEMLTGRPTFEGEDITEILGRVVTTEPDWNRLPPGTPPPIARLLRRALKKDPRRRLGDIRDAWIEIEEAGMAAEGAVPTRAARRTRWPWIASLAVAALIILAMAIPTARHLFETAPPEMRVEISTPPTSSPYDFALSPDGRHLVFVAAGERGEQLWLRSLDRTESQPMAGTEGAQGPFWSADSRSVGFFASRRLHRVDIAGGAPRPLADAPDGRGGAWNADGTILFVPGTNSPMMRVAASGGDPVAIVQLARGSSSMNMPTFLPDGRHFLFTARNAVDSAVRGVHLRSLDGGEPKRLLTDAFSAVAYSRNRLVFIRQGALLAQQLDIARGELTGDPVTLADSVGSNLGTGSGFSVAADGKVAYRAGGGRASQLTWFDRAGKPLATVGAHNELDYPELSPDGRYVAVGRRVQGNDDVSLWDVLRGSYTKLTLGEAEFYPVWSPDGARIAFRSVRNGNYGIYTRLSNGAGGEQALVNSPHTKVPQDWSKDGRFLLYYETQAEGRDIWVLDLTVKDSKPRPVVNTPFQETMAQFSPDGRWIAYQTDESGQVEIVVQAFPEPGGKVTVSTAGGSQPRWRADGKELYFIAPDGKMMAVPVQTAGVTFDVGIPVALFPTRLQGGTVGVVSRPQYDVSSDGRFLINQPVEASTAAPITLILNWNPDSK
jgi:Tol biopolymer transport system component